MIQSTDSGSAERALGTGLAGEAAAAAQDPVQDALKRCSASTRAAAREYRRTRSTDHLPAVIHGLIEHYVERDARAKLQRGDDSLRLVEDLAIDSLTMLEIVFLAEEVLQVTIDNDELRPFRTVGDVKQFIVAKLGGTPQLQPSLLAHLGAAGPAHGRP
jgi:acyl carrier protein